METAGSLFGDPGTFELAGSQKLREFTAFS